MVEEMVVAVALVAAVASCVRSTDIPRAVMLRWPTNRHYTPRNASYFAACTHQGATTAAVLLQSKRCSRCRGWRSRWSKLRTDQ